MVDSQAVITRDRVPLTEQPGAEFTGLMRAEEAVALLSLQPHLEQPGKILFARLGPDSLTTPDPPDTAHRLGFQPPNTATPERIDAIHTRLRTLVRQWRDTDDDTITLTWRRDAR
ncbi:hypothetical protein [Frankia sp. Cas4]|uniref:hypothetical protein n=1 Tax=Frankia sp. Cas4 TaxID=3073927 RepID=UPI002AD2937E|nr:hypothetical protein [Frankia sp. Cas4]